MQYAHNSHQTGFTILVDGMEPKDERKASNVKYNKIK